MDDMKKSPIELVTELLAKMTERAQNAEREIAKAKKDADDWYKNFLNKDAQYVKLNNKLAEEVAAHSETRQALREALETAAKKGKADNEKGQNK